MRLDLFLKKTHLVRQRALAKTLCDAGLVHVNDRPAKPAHLLAPGDRIRLELPRRLLEVQVLALPARGNLARRHIARFLHVMRDEHWRGTDAVLEGLDDASDASQADDTDMDDAAG